MRLPLTGPNAWDYQRGKFSIAPAIEPKQPSRDRVQIAPRLNGDIVRPFGVNISSAEMIAERMKELSK